MDDLKYSTALNIRFGVVDVISSATLEMRIRLSNIMWGNLVGVPLTIPREQV